MSKIWVQSAIRPCRYHFESVQYYFLDFGVTIAHHTINNTVVHSVIRFMCKYKPRRYCESFYGKMWMKCGKCFFRITLTFLWYTKRVSKEISKTNIVLAGINVTNFVYIFNVWHFFYVEIESETSQSYVREAYYIHVYFFIRNLVRA